MKKYTLRLILALTAALLLVACGPSDEEKQKAAEQPRQRRRWPPNRPRWRCRTTDDKAAWQTYFEAVVTVHAQTRRAMKTNHPLHVLCAGRRR